MELDPRLLYSVSVEDRDNLPSAPGIYFVIDANGTIQYIGKAINCHQRWASTGHHKINEVLKLNNPRVAFMWVEESALADIEYRLLLQFKPPLNDVHALGSPSSRIQRAIALLMEENERQHFPGARGCITKNLLCRVANTTYPTVQQFFSRNPDLLRQIDEHNAKHGLTRFQHKGDIADKVWRTIYNEVREKAC